MGLFGKLGRKIDKFATKIDTKLHKNVDKFIEKHAHHGSEPAHSVAKRSVDVSDDIGSQSATGGTAYVIGASEGELTLVGGMIERDYYHAIGF